MVDSRVCREMAIAADAIDQAEVSNKESPTLEPVVPPASSHST